MLRPVQLFKLLADETRSKVVILLRESGELCVCDICAITAESQPKISRHMALLREAELVIDRREGKWVHYRLSPHMPAWAVAIIDSAWNCEREHIQKKLRNAPSVVC
ncbi:metalloregulator ArsR/SmtB family transcription factor [Erwinia sp. V90_4]|jgi:DNA-binding transcriptional ArsR family regulator|uniref:metalloregulator ArsR/SmtB family transcription factor n=1 Tax=Erwinia TaxID=551 RepID=UPI001746BB65|nr:MULTISPECIES: metalloregulator ArsR/SmtB family transcription factor [Erwinia]MBD1374758.1 metalloregulator ArsR/SmtB family transcription factor [Erwinia aphidicola]MBD1377311.1 metalloregulator ArsR/SmtB family transcription factor [Erwinia aphidicola]MBN1085885.1 metalloregulator ArsR/SmtB family transcription factor [Erwinia aphidicola]MDI3440854.1 metalloregulator ArsR/SmtB family transcription factor [Erwinia sp. V90_4]CAH0141084.1 Arsenic resistance transcriptional regulator ArsR2 [E